MRIGIDARLNGYREGGISQYTRCLLDALARLDQVSDYRLLTAARSKIEAVLAPGPNFHTFPVWTPAHHRLERLTLGVETARLRLDVLHSPDFIPPHFGASHFVITVHDLNFLHYPQFQTEASLRYYDGNIRAAVRRADHILAVSQSARDDLVNLLNVPPEKITVQLEGVAPDFRPMSAAEVAPVRQRLALPDSYLLFVGTFEPRKNLLGLLDAYQLLCTRLSDTPPLVLVGQRGWLDTPIFQKVAELGLGERVRWLEDVTTADLPGVYNGAAVLVLPSFHEGFGLPPLEAMACGIPT